MPILGAVIEPSWHRNHRRLRAAFRLLARQPSLLSDSGIVQAFENLQHHHGSTAPNSLLFAMMQNSGHGQSFGGKGSMQQQQFGGKGSFQQHGGGIEGFDSMQQQHGGKGSMQQQQFGGKGSFQQHGGGNEGFDSMQQQHGGNVPMQQQFGGKGSSQHLPGGNGSFQQQSGGNGSMQSQFSGSGSNGTMPQQYGGNGGNGTTQQPFAGNGGNSTLQQQHGGNGIVQQQSGGNIKGGASNGWGQQGVPRDQQYPQSNFGKGSHAANQWSAGNPKYPMSQPHNNGAQVEQAPMTNPSNQHTPQLVPPPKWCPQCGNQCQAFHSYCGMCHFQFPGKGSGKGNYQAYQSGKGSGNNYHGNNYHGNNYQSGNGTSNNYHGNGNQGNANQSGKGTVPDYNLGNDRFTTEMKSFPARIPRCFDVAFELGNFTYTQSAPLEVQWRECAEYLSASKAMMAKINNFQAFLSNKETQITSMAVPAWQRRNFLMQSMRNLPEGATNAHKVDVQQLHKLLGSLVPDSNPKLKQGLLEVMVQIESITTPSPEPEEQASFEEQARDFLGQYTDDNSGYMDLDDEVPQFQPVDNMYGPDMPEEFFDTPPLLKCRRLREKQPLPRGTTLEAVEIAIHSSDSEETPGKQTKADKKEAKKQRRAQALASSKGVIKSGGKQKS